MDPEDDFGQLNTTLFSDTNLDFLESRFGVELEMCVKLSPDCIRGTGLSRLDFENILSFRDKFNVFYKNVLQRSPSFSEIAEKYRYLVLNEKTRTRVNHYFYNLQDSNDMGTEYRELPAKLNKDFDVVPNANSYQTTLGDTIAEGLFKDFHNYKFPIVEEDLSIICGDTKGALKREGAGIPDSFSFRFECITPVLKLEGAVTHTKVRDSVMPILYFFGFGSPECFLLNYSMGFHVNASLFIPQIDKYIAIGKSPFLNQLLRTYIPMERYLYRTVRTRRPPGVNNTYISKFARPLYGNLNKFQAESGGLSAEEIINTRMIANNYIEEKYKAIKRKSPYLLEFRLFEGDSNVNILVNDIFTTLYLLHKTTVEIIRTKGKKGLPLTKNIPLNTVNLNNDNHSGGSRRQQRRPKRHTRKRSQK